MLGASIFITHNSGKVCVSLHEFTPQGTLVSPADSSAGPLPDLFAWRFVTTPRFPHSNAED